MPRSRTRPPSFPCLGLTAMLALGGLAACFVDDGPLLDPGPSSSSSSSRDTGSHETSSSTTANATSDAASSEDGSSDASTTGGPTVTSESTSAPPEGTSESTESSSSEGGSSSSDEGDTAPTMTCMTASDCPFAGSECATVECVAGLCAIAFDLPATFCHGFDDQCDGLGNCVDCVNSGGCGECCTCSVQQVCVPA